MYVQYQVLHNFHVVTTTVSDRLKNKYCVFIVINVYYANYEAGIPFLNEPH